jgi:hypothetical protein
VLVRILATTAALCIVVTSHASPAQTKTPAQAKAKSSSKTSKVNATTPKPETVFDDSLAKLPKAFAGNTVEWVLKNRTIPSKGEFETTAEYERRLQTFKAELYAFVPNEPESFEYDADSEAFSTSIYPGSTDVHSKLGRYFRPFDIHRTKLSESS